MQNKPSTSTNRALNPFVEKHQKVVMGILHGFDRLRLRGTLRQLYCSTVMEAYRKRENCLVWVEDVAKAQSLLHQQVELNWAKELEQLLKQCHPTGARI